MSSAACGRPEAAGGRRDTGRHARPRRGRRRPGAPSRSGRRRAPRPCGRRRSCLAASASAWATPISTGSSARRRTRRGTSVLARAEHHKRHEVLVAQEPGRGALRHRPQPCDVGVPSRGVGARHPPPAAKVGARRGERPPLTRAECEGEREAGRPDGGASDLCRLDDVSGTGPGGRADERTRRARLRSARRARGAQRRPRGPSHRSASSEAKGRTPRRAGRRTHRER